MLLVDILHSTEFTLTRDLFKEHTIDQWHLYGPFLIFLPLFTGIIQNSYYSLLPKEILLHFSPICIFPTYFKVEFQSDHDFTLKNITSQGLGVGDA
jgi:hypothetical protein